jgi:uncharacterized protein (DUF2235 family)
MKRLVFCFDGTWNRLDAPNPTNVVLTAESVLPLTPNGTAQVIFYDEGVGTAPGQKLTGGIFGEGLEQNLNDAYRFLIFNHTPGDEIYVFGFSRGAFTARSFVGLIANSGIPSRHSAARVNEALQLYRKRQDTGPYREKMNKFRLEVGPEICVSAAEDGWRRLSVPDYVSPPMLRIRYVGVWDTVGARGIPNDLLGADLINQEYAFHDLSLSAFVQGARHAVAIDERRTTFSPTLWDNLPDLNKAAGFDPGAADAPYQQKWFPGDHGSVGGGGDIRGLSDQALDWIWDGARNAGLRLDSSNRSPIFGLKPNHMSALANVTKKEGIDPIGWAFDLLSKDDRKPGPDRLDQVSVAARRRWLTPGPDLPEKHGYRPKTLDRVKADLQGLNATDYIAPPPEGDFMVHEVQPRETLSAIAVKYYSDEAAWPVIYAANRYKIDDPNRIYVGQTLRIPNRP